MSDRPSDHAIKFEAVKISMTQSRDGWKLILAVHPDDAPEELLRSLIGSRYMVAAVQLDDRDNPVPLIEKPKTLLPPGEQAVAYAGELCREPEFQRWMYRMGFSTAPNEEATAEGLRAMLGVKSRAELKNNAEKRELLRDIAQSYLDSA